jgi:hypothetical protein
MIQRSFLAIPVLAVALSAALPATLAAQTTSKFTVPPSYALLPGNTLDQGVFGVDRARYAQFVDKAELTGLRSAAKLKEIRYRRPSTRLDKIYTSYEPMRRRANITRPNWQIRVGNFLGNYDNLNAQYENAANKVSMTTVFAAQLNLTTNCPTLTAPANARTPAPFAMKFPFNITTVLYSGRGLCVSHKVYATRGASHIYYVDALLDQPSTGGSVSLISPTSVGCPKNFNRVYGTAPNPGAGSVKLHLFGATPNKPAIAYLGASSTTWNGTNLPLDLSFMGMAPCKIHTGLTFPINTMTDVAGIASLSLPVPANAAYIGAVIYNQWGVAGDRVNPSLGFELSDGVRIKIGNRVGTKVLRMSVISALQGQSRSSSGYIRKNQGAVFQLLY